jgi:hypothetical protein
MVEVAIATGFAGRMWKIVEDGSVSALACAVIRCCWLVYGRSQAAMAQRVGEKRKGSNSVDPEDRSSRGRRQSCGTAVLTLRDR